MENFAREKQLASIRFTKLGTFPMPYSLMRNWGPILHVLGKLFGMLGGYFSKVEDEELEMA